MKHGQRSDSFKESIARFCVCALGDYQHDLRAGGGSGNCPKPLDPLFQSDSNVQGRKGNAPLLALCWTMITRSASRAA